jgi:hypothetical protein
MPVYITRTTGYDRLPDNSLAATEQPADILQLKLLRKRSGCRRTTPRLLAQAKPFDNLAIPIRVTPIEIVQQPPALVHHHNQPAAGCVVFYVGLEVRRQIVDPLAQKRYLHFRRARILYMGSELFDQHCFGFAQVPLSVVP